MRAFWCMFAFLWANAAAPAAAPADNVVPGEAALAAAPVAGGGDVDVRGDLEEGGGGHRHRNLRKARKEKINRRLDVALGAAVAEHAASNPIVQRAVSRIFGFGSLVSVTTMSTVRCNPDHVFVVNVSRTDSRRRDRAVETHTRLTCSRLPMFLNTSIAVITEAFRFSV